MTTVPIKFVSPQFFLTLSIVLLISPVSANDISAQAIAFSCSGCHGTDGQLAKPGFPKLNNQSAISLEKKLLAFKYQQQPSSIMARISKGYKDSELKAVAHYFSQLK